MSQLEMVCADAGDLVSPNVCVGACVRVSGRKGERERRLVLKTVLKSSPKAFEEGLFLGSQDCRVLDLV